MCHTSDMWKICALLLVIPFAMGCDSVQDEGLGTWEGDFEVFGGVRSYVFDLDRGEVVMQHAGKSYTAFVDGDMRRDSLYLRTIGLDDVQARDVTFTGRANRGRAAGSMCMLYTKCDAVELRRR